MLGAAGVAELVDAADSKSAGCKPLSVRVRPPVPLEKQSLTSGCLCFCLRLFSAWSQIAHRIDHHSVPAVVGHQLVGDCLVGLQLGRPPGVCLFAGQMAAHGAFEASDLVSNCPRGGASLVRKVLSAQYGAAHTSLVTSKERSCGAYRCGMFQAKSVNLGELCSGRWCAKKRLGLSKQDACRRGDHLHTVFRQWPNTLCC